MHAHKHETHTEHKRKHIHERDEMNTIDIVTVGTHVPWPASLLRE